MNVGQQAGNHGAIDVIMGDDVLDRDRPALDEEAGGFTQSYDRASQSTKSRTASRPFFPVPPRETLRLESERRRSFIMGAMLR